MKEQENQPKLKEDNWERRTMQELYGMEPEMNLQSANFATTENPLLSEYYRDRNEIDE
jgi:hypothetical protein